MKFVQIPFIISLFFVLSAQEGCESEDVDGDGWTVSDGDCNDRDADVHPGADELCDRVDNDCDGEIDEGVVDESGECLLGSCQDILDANPDAEDGLYTIVLSDGFGDIEVYCDMTRDGGGWTRMMSANYDFFFNTDNWDDYGISSDDNMSILYTRESFVKDGVWTFRLEVGDSGTWQDVEERSHYTIWTQEHDPYTSSTDGSDYVFIGGEESTTCNGFNGLHDQYYLDYGTYCMTSDVDSTEDSNCWWMQISPIKQYPSSSNYPGYLEGYDGPYNYHTWQTLWMR